MATCSTVLPWRIGGTVELDGLPSLGWHRVGHDLSILTAAAAEYYQREIGVNQIFNTCLCLTFLQ